MLKQLQAGTGVLVFLFVALHLANTWLAALGPDVYDGVQLVLRAVYQFAPVEALLLASIAVHMVTGVMRIVTEPRRGLGMRGRLHRYAGFFLMAVIIGHVLAVRGSSWFFDVYPGFHGLAFSVDYVPGYFFPYYFLLATAGFYHALNGLTVASARLGWRIVVPTRALVVASGLAMAATVATLLALGGVTTAIGNPADNEFARLALRLVGADQTPGSQ